MYYNRFRYYDAETGRYISTDPIGLAGGTNHYGYVHNPLTWVDPFGLAECQQSSSRGSIDYGELDSLGRPSGVRATITQDMIGRGTPANPSINPHGWSGNSTRFNEARGHLLDKQLGGSGNIPENLVTLQQTPTNTPTMRGFENQVRAAIDGGQIVTYSSTPRFIL